MLNKLDAVFLYNKIRVSCLLQVAKVIADIRAGLRKPGDGLALMQHPAIKREDSAVSNKTIRVSISHRCH